MAGCSSELVAPIDFDPATETVVFRRAPCGEEGGPTVFVATPETLDVDFPYCDGLAVALHEYETSTDALCLMPGILSTGTSALPIPDRARVGALGEDGIAWDAVPEGQRAIVDLVVPDLDVVACAEAGQCVGASSECACLDACPSPSITPPTFPAGPSVACAPGWEAVAVRPGITACRAFASNVECGSGEVPIPGAGCVALLRPCVGAEWPDGVADLYVRAAAQGVGTRADPFGTLEEALAVAQPGHVIALAPGSYELRGTVDVPNLTIVGTCPGDVTIRNMARSTIRSSGFHLSDMTIALVSDVLSLQEAGTMTLQSVAVEGPRELDLRGQASIRDSVVSAVTRVVGVTSVESSFLDGGVRVRNGRLETRRVTLEGRDTVPLVGTEAQLISLIETYVAASTVALDMTTGGELAVRRSHIDGGIVAYADTATITESYLETGEDGAIVGRCFGSVSELTLYDVVARGAGDREPAFKSLCADADVSRFALVEGNGLWFTHTEVRAVDIQVFDSSDNGVTFVGSPTVGTNRLFVTGSRGVGLAIDDNWPDFGLQAGTLHFADVLVEDSREAAARFDDTSVVVVERASFVDSGGNGLIFAPNSTVTSRITLEDVSVAGTRGDALCGNDLQSPCEGAGIYLYGDLGVGQVIMVLTDVESTGAKAALNIRGKADLELDRVRFSDSQYGAYISAPTIPRSVFVTRVEYAGNETAIEFVQ